MKWILRLCTKHKNNALLKIYPNNTMWCKVKINCRSAAMLQMSLCLPRWSSLHFSHTVCGLVYATAQHISCDILSLMNTTFKTNFNTFLNTHIALNVL